MKRTLNLGIMKITYDSERKPDNSPSETFGECWRRYEWENVLTPIEKLKKWDELNKRIEREQERQEIIRNWGKVKEK